MTPIDFTEWSDAQLDATVRMVQRQGSVHAAALAAEVQRRQDAGTWMTDGSHERVEALVAASRKPRRRVRQR